MKQHRDIETLLKQLNASALKRYGQNFLIDELVIANIIKQANIHQGDVVLEIGPGLGALTKPLLSLSTQYLSYEIDQSFHRYLQSQYPTGTHHRLNFLKAKPSPTNVIVGNLPYYATTEILEKIYKDFSDTQRIVCMIQKEVWPRLVSQPGDEAYGPLAIFMATMGTLTLSFEVPPQAFYPEPHVQSIVFTLEVFPQGPKVETKAFFYFIKKMFLHRRKTILNNLASMLKSRPEAAACLSALKLAENLRPEMIKVDDYIALFKSINQENHYNGKGDI